MSTEPPPIRLADFAQTWTEQPADPQWAPSDRSRPFASITGSTRERLEDVLDTVVALQRAEWLQDGVFVGPRTAPEVYEDLLHCARTLDVTVPPAILTSGVLQSQQVVGTDTRPLLVLSSAFHSLASPDERRFVIGRLLGHCALRQVTDLTSYALLVDQGGIRAVARRAVGPLLEIALAPLGLGMRFALSRWHRGAELAADRAGLVAAQNVNSAHLALLRVALGVTPDAHPQDYLEQLGRNADSESPGQWVELLSNQPFMHKRMQALTEAGPQLLGDAP